MAKKSSPASGTPATTTLDRLGIPYSALTYTHDPAVDNFGWEAAEALGVAAERVFKTLLAECDDGLVVGIVPVTGTLDLKSLARAAGTKKAAMADPALAERKTGYVVGGISPIGQKTRLRTFVDTSAERHHTIYVSGGRRGLDLEIAAHDLLAATGGTLAPIGRPG